MSIKRTYKTRSCDTHDFDRVPDVRGIVLKLGSLVVDEEERSFLTIDTGETVTQVFHSHALGEAFDCAEPGDHIHILYKGKIKTKKGGRTFNRFEVEVWTEEGEEDDEKEGDVDPSDE